MWREIILVSSLIGHPAVRKFAVVEKPDEENGEIVRERLSKQYPCEVEFIFELPKTQSGKIQRFLL